jgi:AGCS family alanine or glycine:cation symporter
MRKYIAFAFTFLLAMTGFGQAEGFDEKINKVFEPFSDAVQGVIFYAVKFEIGGKEIGIPLVLVWLLVGAVFFTIYFKFANIRLFKTAIDIVRGKYDDEEEEEGEVSHFQALTAALSGTVGLGNIAGVAVAISIGGAGATFWMIVAGLLGMSSKFVECTLGVKFRKVSVDGVVHGGPMYYLSDGLKEKGYGLLGKICAGIFAVACIFGSFGGGNMFQSNQAFKAVQPYLAGSSFENAGWLFGVIVAVLVGVVIIGGIKSIAKVTDKIVPLMVGIYVLGSLIVIFANVSLIPMAFMEILNGAFAPAAIGGGIVGVMIQGFKRAAFSNEAGVGSASIAHSAVKTSQPASEGIVSLLEPFIDTVVVCTMTAIVIIITGNHTNEELEGVALTSASFAKVMTWFPYVLSGAVFLFAFSTMISWSYYGLQAWEYLFGSSDVSAYIYKGVFCLFIVIGAAGDLKPVIGFSDAMIFLMCFPNIIGMYILAPIVKAELSSYLKKIKG